MVTIRIYSFPCSNDTQTFEVPCLSCAAIVKEAKLWQALRLAKTNTQESTE